MTDYSRTPSVLTEHVLEHHGCSLYYWTGGDTNRPLVVMMHGATMDHRMFNDQITSLASDYSVLVWDARGHGKSQPGGDDLSLDLYAEDMVHILDALGVEKFAAVGQSLGAYIAQHLYLRVPERMQAMVVIGSTPISKAYSRVEIWALKASLPFFELMPYRSFTQLVANSTAVKEEVRQYALEAARNIPKEEFSRIWKVVTLAVNNRGQPGFQINIPLLLTHGDKDRTGTIKRDMPRWAEAEQQAVYHVIPDAGHNANQDNPEVFNELLQNFLSRVFVSQ